MRLDESCFIEEDGGRKILRTRAGLGSGLELILPGGLIIFFHSGPFAWSGLFGIWVPFIAFGAWFCLMTYFLIKGIRREALEEPTANPLL